MALAALDIVAVHMEDAGQNIKMQPQPPMFGILDSSEENYDVLWEDGRTSTVENSLALDKILPPAVNALNGQRVAVNLTPSANYQASSDYIGVVLNIYKRDQGGAAEPPSDDLALVKLLSSGMFVEVLASRCAVTSTG